MATKSHKQPDDGVKIIIEEIARTQVCFPEIRLFVERIRRVSFATATVESSPEHEKAAFRLWLGDGQKIIQALLRRRLHKTIIDLDVRRGSVLVLKKYRLATANRINGDGEVLYLAIADCYLIAQRILPPLVEGEASQRTIPREAESPPEEQKTAAPRKGYDRYPEVDYTTYRRPIEKKEALQKPQPRKRPHVDSVATEQVTPMLQTSHPATSSNPRLEPTEHSLLVPRGNEWIARASEEHHRRCHLATNIPESQRCPSKEDLYFRKWVDEHPSGGNEDACPAITYYSLRAIMANDPLRPFKDPPKIVSLAAVTGRNKSRNQDVDILAVIESIDASTTKPTRLPLKRDIRIRDSSIDEPVTLGVFMDPENFRSRVGTVALFRHVTTHDWRRGNLNAYPARVKDREWFIPNPVCLGLEDEVRNVERWWTAQQTQKGFA